MNIDQIKLKAYHLWQQAGEPQGQEEKFWFQAENYYLKLNHFEIIFDDLTSTTDSGETWYKDIEETLPQVKTKQFNSLQQKLSWLFNSLKILKSVNSVNLPDDTKVEFIEAAIHASQETNNTIDVEHQLDNEFAEAVQEKLQSEQIEWDRSNGGGVGQSSVEAIGAENEELLINSLLRGDDESSLDAVVASIDSQLGRELYAEDQALIEQQQVQTVS